MSLPRYPKYRDSGVEWLGEVPEQWEVRLFQRCVSVAEGQVDPEEARFSTMALLAPNFIESGTGRLLELETAADQGAESGKYLCRAGDVVYSKIRPALRKVCIAPADCLCSADMYPLRAHSGLTNRFLFWWILSEQFSAAAVLESQRVAMPKINRESLKSLSVAMPSLEEQHLIVIFLEQETSRIDALVAEQRRLMDLLKEKRQAVISHAVTQGLNPHAPMKPSGIEWLGDIPAHWAVVPLKRLIEPGTSISYGIVQPEEPQETGVPFIQTTNMSTGIFDPAVLQKTSAAIAAQYPRSRLRGGEVVLGIRASIGAAHVVPLELAGANLSRGVARIVPNRRVSSTFLVAYLRSEAVAAYWQLCKQGSTFNEVSIETVRELPVAVPPIGEQGILTTEIEGRLESLKALGSDAQRAIDLLQERRTALITAAVTGQIDVRNV